MVDRTLQAVRHQLKAMDCDSYEVGIRNGKTGQMMNRIWTATEIEENLGYLKRMNAKGEDIYIKPAPSKNGRFVLVDDVEQAQLDEMTAKGFEPALIVETSPNNHQAWVKIPTATQQERSQAAKILAIGFHGDKNSADWNHYGRLAGFTNRKPEHADAVGRSPYVLVRDSKGREASNGGALLTLAREFVAKNHDNEITAVLQDHEKNQPQPYDGFEKLKYWYRGFVDHLKERFQDAFDFSRADWRASLSLLGKGHETRVVADVVRECSPGIEIRKGVGVDDYVTNTVYKAAIWRELKAQGAQWDDVKDQLLPLAKHQLAIERIAEQREEQENRREASKYKGPSL